ncbi:MAG: DUF1353 domain-containing protein [bacterium]
MKWVYELEADFTWASGFRVDRDWAFQDRTGVTRLILGRDGAITVTKGYAWDGCTPKLCFFDIHIGVPDGVVDSRTRKPKTYYASLVHDALYQFLTDGLPLSRAQADRCFLRLMAETGFALRWIFYVAVRLWGDLFRRGGRRIRKTKGMRVEWRRSGSHSEL